MTELVTKLTDLEAEQSEIHTRALDLANRLNNVELSKVII